MKNNISISLKKVKIIGVVTSIIFSTMFLLACNMNNKSKESVEVVTSVVPTETGITISSNVPFDVDDPSNLEEAANFAWNEFIALTWPAQAQGPTAYPRGKPLVTGKYGDKGPTGQVVWETYRHRIEAFPAKGNPNGYDPAKPDYGYASEPKYIYKEAIPPLNEGADPNRVPPFINLDEVTQITLNQMYSGAYGEHTGGNNSVVENQQILFLAKVNESYYQYVAKNKYYESEKDTVATIKANSAGYAVTGDDTMYPPPYTNLPSSDKATGKEGAIEIKAAWRRLNPETEDINTFYTSPVRYYEGTENPMGGASTHINGYVDSDDPGVNEIWGLVALHIIHKTPNAPAFVYATFSHYNNILDKDGNSVEDKDGTTYPKYLSEEPFSPALTIIPGATNSDTLQQVYTTSGTVNTNSPQLYFRNSVGSEAINVGSATGPLYSDPVVINRRLYPIPPIITNTNKSAHQAIANTNPNAVWLNYKLVNVQAKPLDYVQDSIAIFKKDGLAPTYFLANEVVETNPSLQNFSGGLIAAGKDAGRIGNFLYDPYTFEKEYDYNVFIRKPGVPLTKVNMGGCMGCHGSQGQKLGGDFSVLLANGRIQEPDVIQFNNADHTEMVKLLEKYFKTLPNK